MDKIDNLEQDWQYLLTFLPEGWQQKAKALGALLRCRKFIDAESLLRTLFIHLGCQGRPESVLKPAV